MKNLLLKLLERFYQKRNLELFEDQKDFLFNLEDLFFTMELEIREDKRFTLKELFTLSFDFLASRLNGNSQMTIQQVFDEAETALNQRVEAPIVKATLIKKENIKHYQPNEKKVYIIKKNIGI